ncbi:casein kinase [Tritrichomonas foetus]|uniref:Casein kinase n=1 Tax=Tritrichomonas foetus TaxID=1144522 RepID=A0A1J4KHR9_9EUKA|nr:casein kinase [Tritrichomonas foetus]|eukprot:OHT09372.1 casein kinase [Tritrichomonas foetus]
MSMKYLSRFIKKSVITIKKFSMLQKFNLQKLKKMKHKKRNSSPLTFNFREKLGAGCFGEVYIGDCVQTGEEVAIKKEYISYKPPQLVYEMKVLRSLSGATGFPKFRGYWSGEGYNALAQTLLGENLGELFRKCNKRFTLKTVLMIADQMISRLQFLHFKNTLHRDIKPENFMIGQNNQDNTIYLIDFGLTKVYRDPISHIHIPMREGRSIVGTARYVSINTHIGIESSRRDDMESLGYLLIYFAKGKLPWQGIKAHDKTVKYGIILEKKRTCSPEELCQGLPKEFVFYLNDVKNLQFDEEPDYNKYREWFRNALLTLDEKYDYDFCWKHAESGELGKSTAKEDAPKISGELHQTPNKFHNTMPVLLRPKLNSISLQSTSHHHHHHHHHNNVNMIIAQPIKKAILPYWRQNLAFL